MESGRPPMPPDASFRQRMLRNILMSQRVCHTSAPKKPNSKKRTRFVFNRLATTLLHLQIPLVDQQPVLPKRRNDDWQINVLSVRKSPWTILCMENEKLTFSKYQPHRSVKSERDSLMRNSVSYNTTLTRRQYAKKFYWSVIEVIYLTIEFSYF